MSSLTNTRTFFNNHSQNWDNETDERQITRLYEIFNKKLSFIRPPFLDLGSGTGVMIPILKNYQKTNCDIIELDIAFNMLRKARDKYKSDGLHYLLADAHNIPLSYDYFNTVLCFQVFPHFNDKLMVTQEIYNLLKSGGSLIILHLMGHKQLNELHRKAGREVANDRILATDKLAELIISAGFHIQHVEEKNDIYLIIARKI